MAATEFTTELHCWLFDVLFTCLEFLISDQDFYPFHADAAFPSFLLKFDIS